jgi:hypothetical protein
MNCINWYLLLAPQVLLRIELGQVSPLEHLELGLPGLSATSCLPVGLVPGGPRTHRGVGQPSARLLVADLAQFLREQVQEQVEVQPQVKTTGKGRTTGTRTSSVPKT